MCTEFDRFFVTSSFADNKGFGCVDLGKIKMKKKQKTSERFILNTCKNYLATQKMASTLAAMLDVIKTKQSFHQMSNTNIFGYLTTFSL